MKVYKMYEAPKMEIVEVELEAMLAESTGMPEVDGEDGDDKEW